MDVKGKKYENVGSKTIKIEKKWDLVISKSFSENSHMGKPVHVSVSVRNKGLCDINNIVLKDSIVSEMHLQEDTTLNKTLSLKSGETAEKVFEIHPHSGNSGGIYLPDNHSYLYSCPMDRVKK